MICLWWVLLEKWMKFIGVAVYVIRGGKMFSPNYDLLRCFHTFILVSGRYPLFYRWRFLVYGIESTKVCWTKFKATALRVFSRSTFSQFTTECSTQSFHKVVYSSISNPVFARFLSYWQVCPFRNIFACRFPRHACFASFVKMMKCVSVIRNMHSVKKSEC